MAGNPPPRRRTSNASPERAPAPKPAREWVRPRFLLVLGAILVAVTTLIVALRRADRLDDAPSPTAKAPNEPVAPVESAELAPDNGGPIPTTIVPRRIPPEGIEGAGDFASAFAKALPVALRRIGFGPRLVEHHAGAGTRSSDWRIAVPANFPPLRVNAEVTRVAAACGGEVYWAEQDSGDIRTVIVSVGDGDHVTDRVVIHQNARKTFTGTIAFVIDDAGHRPVGRTRAFLGLPFALTLAVLPGGANAAAVSEAARAAGMDVIVHLPMEPDGDGEPLEQKTLLSSMDDATIREIAAEHLGAVPGAIGANNHMGSKATADARVMDVVLGVLREKGMFFVDSRTTAESVAAARARELGVLVAERRAFLDNRHEVGAIVGEIEAAARLAKDGRPVVAIGHDRDETYRALAQALPRLEEQGFRICLVAELVR